MKISTFYCDPALPTARTSSVLMSIPHCGTQIPERYRESFAVDQPKILADTDWRVQDLCAFFPKAGGRRIYAKVSRSIIDLNRPASLDDHPLYRSSSRLSTGLIPEVTFAGEALREHPVSETERQERLETYYQPYHAMIRQVLDETRALYPHVLLLDMHSIRREVPLIYPELLPDLILSNRDQSSSQPELLAVASQALKKAYPGLNLSLNDPFKGGEITRKFGQPEAGFHSLQVEICQDLYLDDSSKQLSPNSVKLSQALASMVQALAEKLETLR